MTGQLQVTSLESTTQLTTNGTITVGQTTINSTSINIQGSNAVINATSVKVGNSSHNTVLNALISDNAIFVGNTNYFPAPLDIFSWASAATYYNNCTISRDTTISPSPAGGIPFKVTQTGPDPHPETYNSNTWNLFPIAPGDVIKTSGYIRIDVDTTISGATYLLNLPANTSGNFGTLTKTDQITRIDATANEWYYFEIVTTITGSNSGFMQIRPDGYGVSVTSTVANTWYDGIKVEKGTTSLLTETVNTQIFTANGTWGKPSWATTGNELVVVHMWGGGGGGITGGAGGGGAHVFGYYKASQLGSTANVVVGAGGVPGGGLGGFGSNSTFANSTNGLLIAYGGGPGTVISSTGYGGGGGGWSSNGFNAGGAPLEGSAGSATTTPGGVSTFGGGGGGGAGGGTSAASFGGDSVYGGGGGGSGNNSTSTPSRGGSSIYGGGGGAGSNATASNTAGSSVYGGRGATFSTAAGIPGGGGCGANNTSGARGEVRVYTYRITG